MPFKRPEQPTYQMTDKKVVELSTRIHLGFPELTKSDLMLLSIQYHLRKETHRLMRKVAYGGIPGENRYNYEIINKTPVQKHEGIENPGISNRAISLVHQSTENSQLEKMAQKEIQQGRTASANDSRKKVPQQSMPQPIQKKAGKNARTPQVFQEKQRNPQSQDLMIGDSTNSTIIRTKKLTSR